MMRAPISVFLCLAVAAPAVISAGCGYTTRSQLSAGYKSVYVENFTNSIKVADEQSNVRMYRGYRPGMEVDITRAVIDAFLRDGNLKIAKEADADVVLKARLVDFKKDALRYDANNVVEEYRIKIMVDMELLDSKTGNPLWKEGAFAGEATYRTSGTLAKSEAAGLKDAVADLARRIVERTVEAW